MINIPSGSIAASDVIFSSELEAIEALIYLLHRGEQFVWEGRYVGMDQKGQVCHIGKHSNPESGDVVMGWDPSYSELRSVAEGIGREPLLLRLREYLDRVKP